MSSRKLGLRRVVTGALVFALLLALVPTTFLNAAIGPTAVSLTPSATTVTRGETFTVAVNVVRGTGVHSLNAVDFTLSYNHEAVRRVGFAHGAAANFVAPMADPRNTFGTPADGDAPEVLGAPTPGTYDFSVPGNPIGRVPSAANGEGVVATITFEAIADVEYDADIRLVSALADSDEGITAADMDVDTAIIALTLEDPVLDPPGAVDVAFANAPIFGGTRHNVRLVVTNNVADSVLPATSYVLVRTSNTGPDAPSMTIPVQIGQALSYGQSSEPIEVGLIVGNARLEAFVWSQAWPEDAQLVSDAFRLGATTDGVTVLGTVIQPLN